MASYHLSVKSVSRSSGRSAVAAAAYRAAEDLTDKRLAVRHDYRRKSGVAHAEIVVPEAAPDWVRDRLLLWNGAEAAENRKNSVVAREWELALPAELGDGERRELALDFAHTLVERYGVAADVCIHLPHREGDQRNHHAHILTTTREIGAEGFGAKTRILDVKQTSSVEVTAMREIWAERQNAALAAQEEAARVDHRSLEVRHAEMEAERDRLADLLEAQRFDKAALARAKRKAETRFDRVFEERGIPAQEDSAEEQKREALELDLATVTLRAEILDRPAEVKLGPSTSAVERKAKRRAEAEGRSYTPVTERGEQVHAVRQQRDLFEVAIASLSKLRGAAKTVIHEIAAWVRNGIWPVDRQETPKEALPDKEAQGQALREELSAIGRSKGETAQQSVRGPEAAPKTAPDVAKATERMILYSEELVHLVEDPEERVRLSAQLGQEMIKLAVLAGRPEWAEGAGPADRPVAEARAALVKAATGEVGERILAEADQNARSAFDTAGIEPEAALHRIRYEGPVDRARAALWRTEEVAESARSRGAGKEDAAMAVEQGHVTAYAVYDNAAKRLRASMQQSQEAEAAKAERLELEKQSERLGRGRGRKL